jgi:hypothetical protein
MSQMICEEVFLGMQPLGKECFPAVLVETVGEPYLSRQISP